MRNIHITLNKCFGYTSDGAETRIEKNAGAISSLNQKMGDNDLFKLFIYHYFLQQENILAKSIISNCMKPIK